MKLIDKQNAGLGVRVINTLTMNSVMVFKAAAGKTVETFLRSREAFLETAGYG